MNQKGKETKKRKGISANRIVFPVVAVLVVLHIFIVYLIISINTQSSDLSMTMQTSSMYIEEATSVLAGSSLLSETSGNYVLLPIAEDGESNFAPLMAYANELLEDRRGPQVLARFQKYNVPPDTLDKMAKASDAASEMMDAQLHAIALVNSVYPLPDLPQLNSLPLPQLTAKEQSLSKQERLSAANMLILGTEYSANKQAVSANINACTASIKTAMNVQAMENARNIKTLRVLLWIVTFAIIIILAVVFTLFYRLVILPLKGDARLITTDHMLDEKSGLLEVRMLAEAYNALLQRRDTLEGILRSAAETDVLTNLPNRYSFEQSLVECAETGHAFSVILFDVNFLKQTNDTLGHDAGDALIRSAADCIASCFGNAERNNCFRIGGDEFAAVLENCPEEQMERIVERFLKEQKDRQISIAWGSASTDKIEETTFKKLMKQADLKMYEQKEKMHRDGSTPAFTPSV